MPRIASLAVLAAAVVAACVLAVAPTSARPHKYDTSFKGYSDTVLNVHLTCHTHDDVGWLKTVDQYFMGANNSIQHAGVQYVLDSVIPALEKNPDRKFLYIEQAFFQRWWRQQDDDIRARTKKLHADGQLVFENGGWCMHDEANTHYIAMVDQTTVGHRLLLEEFGAIPRVGWQIDPFGHSATQAALLSAEVGFDSLFFGRTDYQDRKKRLSERRMEMVWRASPSLGAAAQVFTGAFQSGNYGPPGGYCFDQFCSDTPMQDDHNLEDYDVDSRVDGFVKAAMSHYNNAPQTNHIMFKMGSDFQYENANEWMKNLDKLIHWTNLDGRINVFYSDPHAFTVAQNNANLTWTVKTDDFFPYADCPWCYWTGYFTSRPALKGYIRQASAYLQATKQLSAAMGQNGSAWEKFAEDMGVVQHHDAVAGTEKQHVAYDYARRIHEGMTAGEAIVNDALAELVTKTGVKHMSGSDFSQCQLMNQSICEATGSNAAGFVAVLYNSEAQKMTKLLRIPVPTADFHAFNASGGLLHSQIIPNDDVKAGALGYSLHVEAVVPPTGFTTIFAKPASTLNSHERRLTMEAAFRAQAKMVAEAEAAARQAASTISISNQHLSADFDATTGRLVSMTNAKDGVAITLNQDWYWYNSSASGNGFSAADSHQNSGAYIFRPNGTKPFAVNSGPVTVTVTRGPVVQEVTQVWDASWLRQTVRLYEGADHLEVEFTVGPVPIDDNFGHEVITKYTTNISSNAHYYTDSNGRELQTRIRDYRPTWKLNLTEPVSANYYPVNALMTMKDDAAQFTVLTDRSEGGCSMTDGELELMVHRRILYDDGRGVGEPLNETTSCTPYPNFRRLGTGLIITAKHRLQLSTPKLAARGYRTLQQDVYAQPIIAFAALPGAVSDWVSSHNTEWSMLQAALPANVGLMTVEPRGAKLVLLRLAHLYAVGEDSVLSGPATVDLATLFADLKVASVEEMSLTANQPLSNVHRLQWKTEDAVPVPERDIFPTGAPGPVTLNAMQIRTFMLTLE